MKGTYHVLGNRRAVSTHFSTVNVDAQIMLSENGGSQQVLHLRNPDVAVQREQRGDLQESS